MLGNPTGLVRTYLLTAEDDGIGMVNLWATRAQFGAFFSDYRITTIQSRLGMLRQEIFSVPLLMNPPAHQEK
jgi:hypothetical protein